MNTIIPTNIVFNFILFQKWQIFVSVFLSLIIISSYLLIYKLRLKYISNKIEYNLAQELKSKYLKLISNLDINSSNFFYDLNFLLRSYLENLNKFPWVTKMTKNEIFQRNIKSLDFKSLLENCEKYEFWNIKYVSNDLKNDSKTKALSIINKS